MFSSSLARVRPAALIRLSLVAVLVVVAGCSGSPTGPSQPPPAIPDAPQISCPALPPQVSAVGGPIPVTFAASVLQGAAPVTSTCTPLSGTTFPVGTTGVTCTATDARQRTATCSFTVVVQPPPRLTLTRFIAFGDSLTWGEDGLATLTLGETLGLSRIQAVRLQGREYPVVLERLLRARYTTQLPTVAERGLPGESAGSSSALSRFADFVSRREYEVVLLMEGANDICCGSGGNPPGVAPAIANLRRMIVEARNRGIQVLLATLPPMNPSGARGAMRYQALPLLNAEIRSLAASQGVPLVDVFDAFGGNLSLIGADGLHPNGDGFARIAQKFFEVIRERFEPPQSLGPATAAPLSALPAR